MGRIEDKIGRETFCNSIISLIELVNKEKAWSIAINGNWGSGKTWVLNSIEETIKNKNKDDILIIKYNTWENDFYKDPLIAILNEIIKNFDDYLSKNDTKKALIGTAKEKFINIIKKLPYIAGGVISTFNPLMGKAIDGIIDACKRVENKKEAIEDERNNVFKEYTSYKTIIDEINNIMQDLSKDYTLLFIVDELDRCLPSYAIKVLERLHHVFKENNKNLIMLLAIDSKQIEQMLKHEFGDNTDSDKYLSKFFDYSLILPEDCNNNYISNCINEYFPDNEGKEFSTELMLAILKDAGTRDTEKILKTAKFFTDYLKGDITHFNFLAFLIAIRKYSDFETTYIQNFNKNINSPHASDYPSYIILSECTTTYKTHKIYSEQLFALVKKYTVENNEFPYSSFFHSKSIYLDYLVYYLSYFYTKAFKRFRVYPAKGFNQNIDTSKLDKIKSIENLLNI